MAAKKTSSSTSSLTFEKALAELEGLIARLESDELTLEEAVENFEKGVGLLRTCQARLAGADGKISELLKGEQGQFLERELGLTADFLAEGTDSTDE
ncbi:MAG: exodeoxyribonuclease VII small subunit [Chitinivibrionales bacterium]|nr:exodeoxyribonuclease VII small subunit [Chitinivibrionales bacterium]